MDGQKENKFVMTEIRKIMMVVTNIVKLKMDGIVLKKKIRDGNANGKT